MEGVYHDAEFVSLISYRLQRFKQKDKLKWNFRCPFCGDSEKSLLKARGYLFQGKKGLFFRCYNCDAKSSFKDFLKYVDPGVFTQYQTSRYRDIETDYAEMEEEDLEAFQVEIPANIAIQKKKKKAKPPSVLIPVKSLSKGHFARKYLRQRKIPKKFWGDIHFSVKLESIIGVRRKYLEPRIIFTCSNPSGEPFAYQGRIIPDYQGLRYKIVKLNEELPLVFGLDRIDFNRTVYVVEGQIDSLFLDNCVAACCANLASIDQILDAHGISMPSDVVLIYDNEKRNKDIVRRMLRAAKLGYKICVWPDWVKQKDINLMVLAGLTPSQIIAENTYSGLKAKFQINRWMRCDPFEQPSYQANP